MSAQPGTHAAAASEFFENFMFSSMSVNVHMSMNLAAGRYYRRSNDERQSANEHEFGRGCVRGQKMSVNVHMSVNLAAGV